MGATSFLVGAVASGISRIGLPFPAVWWPPSAGPIPDDLVAKLSD
jgi:hypothetical protein